MSLTELLPAIRALPKAEQVQLHLLIDGVTEVLPAPGPESEVATLGVLFPPGVPLDVHTPPGGHESAAQLVQLLAAHGVRV